ncbi:MAG: glycosyltransferase, partial [Cyclobacteriaceae bacterium]|nr:glycosyltransferase [Cyclobacteriaceae bacterium]
MREKPYIAFLIDTLQTGGAEKSILAIASKLKLVQPVVCHIYQNDELKHHFNKSGIRVISLDVKGPYSFKEASNKLHSVLKQEKPDLVVATLLRSELISRWVCKRMNIPNVGTFVSDTYAPNALQTMSWLMCIKVRFFWLLNVLTARWCVAFLANSESIKQSNCNALYVSPHKVKVIYRGRTTDNF